MSNLGYESDETIYFHRLSVIASEIILYCACHQFFSSNALYRNNLEDPTTILFSLIVFNAGLILVDNIHFQYNGMLLGILIFVIAQAHRAQYLSMSSLFSLLVLSKHLFAPLSPLFAIYLIKSYCLEKSAPESERVFDSLINESKNNRFMKRFASLVLIAILFSVAAFGPFLAQPAGVGQIKQVNIVFVLLIRFILFHVLLLLLPVLLSQLLLLPLLLSLLLLIHILYFFFFFFLSCS